MHNRAPFTTVGLLIAVCVPVLSQPMSGVYPIGPDGPGVDSFASIQAAASALSARGLGGDADFPIAPGLYSGPVVINSVAGGQTFAARFASEQTGVMVDAGGSGYALLVLNSSHISMQGVRFRGVRGAGSAYVRFVDSDSGAVRSCRFGDSAEFAVQVQGSDWFRLDSTRVDGPLVGTDTRALDFRDCRFASVERCSIIGAVGTGLYLTDGSDFRIYRMSVAAPSLAGIRIVNSPRAALGRCFVHGSPQYGIRAVGATRAFFDSVTVASPTLVGAYFERCDTLVYRIPMIAASADRGVWVRESQACTLQSVSVMGQTRIGFHIDHSPGLVSDSIQVTAIENDTGCAVFIDSSPGSTLTHTQMVGNCGTGVLVHNSDRVKFRHLRLRGLVREAGVAIERSDGVMVWTCSLNVTTSVAGAAGVVLRDGCNDDTLLGVAVLANTDYGIRADSTVRGLVVASCYIADWTGDGVLLEQSRSAKLLFNTIVSPTAASVAGVRFRGVSGAEAKDNIIWNQGTSGSACYSVEGALPFAAGASDYNDLFVNTGTGVLALVNDTLCVGLPDWRDRAAGSDLHSLSRDPLFDAVGDFHLQAGSPCRDSGLPIAGITVDLDGDPRDPVAPDIGCDEYSVGAVEQAPAGLCRPAGVTSSGLASVRYTLREPADVRLQVFDAAGRTVSSRRERLAAGSHETALDLRRSAAGVYLVRISAGSATGTVKLIRP